MENPNDSAITKKPPTIVFGLDSGDYRLCEEWADKGDLPNLRKFIQRSQRRKVNNPLGFEASSLWPSFNLGADVDEHGQFDGFNVFDTKSYTRRRLGKKEFTGTYFWQHLSDLGKRVLVVDPPYVPVIEGINGIQVIDWMTHDVRTGDNWLQTSPPELAQAITQDFGVNPFSKSKISCPSDEIRPNTEQAIRGMCDSLKTRIRAKIEFLKQQLSQKKWDCCYCVFHELHDMGYMCWHVHDTAHADHDPEIREIVGDPL